MQQPCIVTSPQLSLPAVAREMREQDLQRMPVIENGEIAGVVSITDVVMESDVASVDLPKGFAERVEVALRRKRLHWDEAGTTNPDRKMAESVLSELSTEPS